jgi:AraC-like DNA-binding protein
VGTARGVLRHAVGPGVFHHARIAPAPALAALVQHFWSVRWDLRGMEPQLRETLPHPNVHLVFEAAGGSRVHGIHSGRFTTVLEGRGGVFGVKFRPGALRPFLGGPVASLRDRSLLPETVFGADATRLEQEVLAGGNDDQRTAAVERYLLARLPPPDPQVARAGDIVDAIAAEPGITSVEHLLERWQTSKRSLQRLFNEYVGVGPKWVINRYRLHEALERLAQGGNVEWARLALDLGYFDQAHFIRDFKALVGRTPGEYLRQAEPGG